MGMRGREFGGRKKMESWKWGSSHFLWKVVSKQGNVLQFLLISWLFSYVYFISFFWFWSRQVDSMWTNYPVFWIMWFIYRKRYLSVHVENYVQDREEIYPLIQKYNFYNYFLNDWLILPFIKSISHTHETQFDHVIIYMQSSNNWFFLFFPFFLIDRILIEWIKNQSQA